MKMNCTLHATPFQLMQKINDKLKKMNPELCFNPKEKILKVNSQCDFFLEPDESIGKFAYINECIKNNKTPELWIIDNPLKDEFDSLDGEKIGIVRSDTISKSTIANKTFHKHNTTTEESSRMNLFNFNQNQTSHNNFSTIFKKNSIRISYEEYEKKLQPKEEETKRTETSRTKTIAKQFEEKINENKNIHQNKNQNNNDKIKKCHTRNKSAQSDLSEITKLSFYNIKQTNNLNVNRFFNIASFNPTSNEARISINHDNPKKPKKKNIVNISLNQDPVNEFLFELNKIIKASVENGIKKIESKETKFSTEEQDDDIDEMIAKRVRSRGVGLSKFIY